MTNILEPSKIPQSIRPFVKAIEGKPDYARRMARLCSDLSHKVDFEDLKKLAVEVRKLAPNDQIVLRFTGNIINKAMPGWHFGCLDDVNRIQAYQTAMKNLIQDDSVVLDVGAGCGVLSLFAAAAGAKHVYAVELESLAAEAARDIIRLNGYEDRITVINKDILDVKIGEDIPEKCNFVVQDIIWPKPFSRDIHKFLIYCQIHLLTQDAVFCPEVIRLMGVLSDAEPHIAWPDYGDYFGFDLSPMNILAHRAPEYARPYAPKSLVTDAFALTSFDMRKLDKIKDHEWEMTVPATQDGAVHHLLKWLEFEFPDGTRLHNGPDSRSVRALTVSRYFDPVPVTAGESITLKNQLKDGVVETSI